MNTAETDAIVIKSIEGRVREADAEIREVQRTLDRKRARRSYLHSTLLDYKGSEDMTALDAAASEPALPTAQVETDSRPKPRKYGRKPSPNTKLIVATIEAVMSRARRPIHRDWILTVLKATPNVELNAYKPHDTLSHHLSKNDQFVSVVPGEGVWSLPEYADRPPIWEDDDLEFELAREEKSPSDVLKLNVYNQETKIGEK